jgi:sulfate permease, SulP family
MGTLPRDISSGAMTAVVSLAYSLSCAALIFSGPLADGLPYGIAAALVAMSLCAFAVALLSPFRRAVAGPDGNAAAVLGAMTATVVTEMTRDGAPPAAILSTVLASIAIATAVTGLVLFLLGELRAARWVRFIPYPVMGGFIAAVGILLIAGSVRVGTGSSLVMANVGALLQPAALVQLAVTVAFALAIIFATSRVPHALGLALMLVVGVAIADIAFAFTPGGLRAGADSGWFLNFHSRASWEPWYVRGHLPAVSWIEIAQRWPDLVTCVLVSAITILFNSTAFEIESHADEDLDQELRADGVANLASAAAGGFIGYFSLTRSAFNLRLGGTGRTSGITVAILGAGVLFAGAWIVDAVPKFVLAGLLLYLGINLINQWVLKTRKQLAPLEYGALLLILIVNVWFGFLPGLGVGLIVGTMLFAFNYSRVAIIAQSRSATDFRSTLMRSPEEIAVLATHGGEIRVFDLQGFLFFGLSDRLYRTARTHAIDVGARFVIFDFHRVIGIDSAAASSFVKIARAAAHTGARIVFTAMDDDVARQWVAASEEINDDIEHFGDLDHAMEWCEDQVIEGHEPDAAEDVSLEAWLAEEFGGNADLAERFVVHLAPLELARGDALCFEGEPADSMFFIERGRVGVVTHASGHSFRLRSLGNRTILGEMGLYRDVLRSASAIAERASLVHVLSRDSFQDIELTDPALASAIHSTIVRTLSDRLSYQNSQIAALA